MPEVILTEDQVRIVAESFGPVIVRDPSGNELGRLEPKPSPKEIAELKRRAASPGPFFSAAGPGPLAGVAGRVGSHRRVRRSRHARIPRAPGRGGPGAHAE